MFERSLPLKNPRVRGSQWKRGATKEGRTGRKRKYVCLPVDGIGIVPGKPWRALELFQSWNSAEERLLSWTDVVRWMPWRHRRGEPTVRSSVPRAFFWMRTLRKYGRWVTARTLRGQRRESSFSRADTRTRGLVIRNIRTRSTRVSSSNTRPLYSHHLQGGSL